VRFGLTSIKKIGDPPLSFEDSFILDPHDIWLCT